MTSADLVVDTYEARGWGIVFPLPKGKKFPPPNGITGGESPYPTRRQAGRWLAEDRYGNFGLRVPAGVLGIDFDSRKGGEVFAWAKPYMDLAPRSTSRGADDPSGVYFVRVPDALLSEIRDRHLASGGTEAVRPQHRYAAVWPSVHPDTKRTYVWYSPDGVELDGPPSLDDLPEIPESVVRTAISAAPRSSKSAALAGSLNGPARKIEFHELGGMKALMAGYFPYATDITPAMERARKSYETKRIQALTDDLEALTASSDPWEPTVGSLALALYSIALAPWSTLSVEQAHSLIVEHGPTCEKAQQQGVHGHAGACWTEVNLSSRAERSLGQHDGGWMQLPGSLRGDSMPGETGLAKQPNESTDPDDDDFFEVGEPGDSDGSGGSDGDDDFFEGDETDGGELIWLTRDLPLEDPPEPMAMSFCFRGMLSILSGPPGTGKSTIASRLCVGYKTLWCSSEEARGTIHARSLILENDDVAVPPELVTLHDLPKIDRWLTENPDIELLVLDNLQSFASIKDDSYNDAVVKTALAPLLAVLMKHGVACLGLSHPTKARTSAVAGSGAWEQIARHVLLAHSAYLQPDGSFITERREEGHHVLVTVAKTNYPYREAKLFRSSRELVPVRTESGKEVFDWLAEPVEDESLRRSAEAAINGEEGGKRSAPRRQSQELPEVEDPQALLDGLWIETEQLAHRLGVPINRILASLARYDLTAVKVAEGRLVRVSRIDDPVQEMQVPLGEHDESELMASLGVSRDTHLMWMLSHLGLQADMRGGAVVVTSANEDETEAALLDAGLGEL